jgi:integrase/recombinase XerD
MNIDDIYWKESLVRVTGKGSKERMVPFGERAAACLKEYLENERPALLGKGNPTRALFISRRGKRLSRKSIWRNYSRLASLFGLPTRVHNLRHSFATEMLRGGAGLRSVQALLGHADLTTTQIYTHVDTSDLRKAHNRYLGALNIDTSTSDTHKEGH